MNSVLNPDAQTELERLREEVQQLRKALAKRSTPPLPGFVTDDTPNLPALINNHELISDLAAFADGTLEESYVRRKYHLLDEATWERLGKDEALIEKIEEARIARIRSGATKRERAQKSVVKSVPVLEEILLDPKQSAKHRIDSAKVLDSFSGNGPKDAPEQDRVVIRIDLGADVRAKGQESNPADVIEIEASVRPNPNPDDNTLSLPGFAV